MNIFKCGDVRLIKILTRGFIALFVLFRIVFLSAQASCALWKGSYRRYSSLWFYQYSEISYISSLQITHTFQEHFYLYSPTLVTPGNIQCALTQFVKSVYGKKHNLNDQKIKRNSAHKFLFLEKRAGKFKVSCLKGGQF